MMEDEEACVIIHILAFQNKRVHIGTILLGEMCILFYFIWY